MAVAKARLSWPVALAVSFSIAAAALAAQPQPLPFVVSGDSAARIAWGQLFASPNDDWVNELVPLANGNVLAAGFLNRLDGEAPSDWTALSAELSPGGAVIARYAYGAGGGIDAFFAAHEAADGRRMLAGFTTRIGGGGINALSLLARSDGTILKENAFGGAGYDRFTGVARAEDGYLFLGHSQPEHEDRRRVFVVKTDLENLPVWERVHDASESWGALYIEPSGDGGFIVAGGMTAPDGDGDMFAMRIDSEGRERWRRRVGTRGWNEVNHGLVMRPQGAIVLVGYTHPRGGEVNDLVAATLSPSGELVRLERFGGSGDDRTILARPDKAGRIWIVGHTASAGAGGSDLLVARLDAEGSYDPAAVTVGGAADDNGTAILPLDDGSILLAGFSTGLGVGRQDAFVLRMTAPAWDRPNPAFRREVAVQP